MRAARLLLLIATLPALLRCAQSVQGPLPGASEGWLNNSEPQPASPVSAEAVRTAVVPWSGYAEVQHWPPVNSAPFLSRGHRPEQQVDVRVNAAAAPSYAGLVTDTVFPEGSVLALLPHSGSGHGYVMEKHSGTWSYRELDAQGGVVSAGQLRLCASCHAQAPADAVFGLPREP